MEEPIPNQNWESMHRDMFVVFIKFGVYLSLYNSFYNPT